MDKYSDETAAGGLELDSDTMKKINGFARRELRPEEVYVFPIVLCDNEIDRDNERFSVNALKTLAELFVGKTGIFDHDAKGSSQTARIFETEIKTDPGRLTAAGEEYTYLLGRAYMIKTGKTESLIAEIDAGIKKEVSVSCSVEKEICSICKADKRKNPCAHIKGKKYKGKVCHTILQEPKDAYEWSFVAIPAQKNAGVTKSFCKSFAKDSDKIKALKSEMSQLKSDMSLLYDGLLGEVNSLLWVCEPFYDKNAAEKMISKMSPAELLEYKKILKDKAGGKNLAPLLFKPDRNKNNEFKLNKKEK